MQYLCTVHHEWADCEVSFAESIWGERVNTIGFCCRQCKTGRYLISVPPPARDAAAEWLTKFLLEAPRRESGVAAAAERAGHRWPLVRRLAMDMDFIVEPDRWHLPPEHPLRRGGA